METSSQLLMNLFQMRVPIAANETAAHMSFIVLTPDQDAW